MMIPYVIHLLFLCYTILLFLRIASSWFPHHIQSHQFCRFLSFYTDPYLNLFRKVLPPLGGVLDISPILGFFALRILEAMLQGFFR